MGRTEEWQEIFYLKNDQSFRLSFSLYHALFPNSFIRLYAMFSSFVCFVFHSSAHLFILISLFRASEDRRDMLGKRYII